MNLCEALLDTSLYRRVPRRDRYCELLLLVGPSGTPKGDPSTQGAGYIQP